MKPLKVQAVRYHRNGCGGEGFCVVRFAWKDKGERRARRMVATVFDSACAVLDLDAPWLCWRGDRFETELRIAIAVADVTGEAYVEAVS